MKTTSKNLFRCLGEASCAAWILSMLLAGLSLIPAGRVTAQTFTTLHNFTGRTDGSDGSHPYSSLALSGNTLYGTTRDGGFADGAVFRVNTDGTGFSTLHSFTGAYPNGDGAWPLAGLILSGNALYGTVSSSWTGGTVFKVNTNGTGFTTLHRFNSDTNDVGEHPRAGLILSSNTLYGTASGSSSGGGTVFAVHTDGTGFTTLYHFTYGDDGATPSAGLVLWGNTLYGTAAYGGALANAGTVFAIHTDGTGFTILHSFNGGSEGSTPLAGLVLSGNTLYGTTSSGSGCGTVFAVNTDGTGFTNLHDLNCGSDGAGPVADLILSGSTLYGTAQYGGSSENGTVFAMNTDGTGFTVLHSFSATACDNCPNSDGRFPSAGLILSGNTLYGTTAFGGSSGYGTAFSLSLPPPPPKLKIIPSGAHVILTWPTNASGLTLQSTTNLVSPAVWTTVSPGPVVVNGQNTVTNPISGAQNFYRLAQ